MNPKDARLSIVVSITTSIIEVKGNTAIMHRPLTRALSDKKYPSASPAPKKQDDCEKPIINYQEVRNTLSARTTFYC
jgi:hypothetical protein